MAGSRLRHLDLSSCGVGGDATAEALGPAPEAQEGSPRALRLFDNPVGPARVRRLSEELRVMISSSSVLVVTLVGWRASSGGVVTRGQCSAAQAAGLLLLREPTASSLRLLLDLLHRNEIVGDEEGRLAALALFARALGRSR